MTSNEMNRVDLRPDARPQSTSSEIVTIVHRIEEAFSRVDPAGWVQAILDVKGISFGESREHVVRVAELSGKLAEATDCDPLMVAEVQISALFHDIGKLSIPAAILEKPTALSDVERIKVESHTTIGREILLYGRTNTLKAAAEVAHCHHERWDGRGYPNRLAESAIPFAARVVSIADVYDALTSNRSYRPAYGQDDAIGKMINEMSSHFDPSLLTTFLKLVRDIEPSKQVPHAHYTQLNSRSDLATTVDNSQ